MVIIILDLAKRTCTTCQNQLYSMILRQNLSVNCAGEGQKLLNVSFKS